jgi:hypothetical protein
MNDNSDLNYIWKIVEERGFTAVHAYRDSNESFKWYCQLLHPDIERVHGMGISYIDALRDALYK